MCGKLGLAAAALSILVTLPSTATLIAADRDLRLVDAVKQRDQATARALLKQHVDVNSTHPDGATPLAWAVYWDDVELTKELIRVGANVSSANDLGITPLSLACANGNGAVVEMLLAAGADPNVTSFTTRETALITAARTGNVRVVTALLAYGANVNAATMMGQTALMWAISAKHSEVARVLIENGADIHARSRVRPRSGAANNNAANAANGDVDKDGGFTPLLFAARSGDVASARLLLRAGADINVPAADGTTPLIVAAGRKQASTAIFLLEQGADPDAGPGYTALHAAVPAGQLTLVQALLAHGANPNARVEKGRALGSMFRALSPAAMGSGMGSLEGATPLWLAARYVDVNVMRALRAGGGDPLMPSKDHTTPLMVAAGLTQIEAPHGPRELDSQWRTAWDASSAVEAVKLLLEWGSDVNAVNDARETALHGAAYAGAKPVIQFLVEHDAKINVMNELDQTPLLLAQGHAGSGGTFFSYPEASELLLKLGADPTVGTRVGYRTGEAGQDTVGGARRKKPGESK